MLDKVFNLFYLTHISTNNNKKNIEKLYYL